MPDTNWVEQEPARLTFIKREGTGSYDIVCCTWRCGPDEIYTSAAVKDDHVDFELNDTHEVNGETYQDIQGKLHDWGKSNGEKVVVVALDPGHHELDEDAPPLYTQIPESKILSMNAMTTED